MESASDRAIIEETFGLAGWIGQTQGMKAAHSHRDLELNYVLSGAMIYIVGGRIVQLPQNRICLLWGGVPHQMLRKPQPVEAIWITIPLATAMRWGLPEALVRPLLSRGLVIDPEPKLSDRDLLQQWLADLPGRSRRQMSADPPADVQRITLLEIEARLRRLSRALQTRCDDTHAAGELGAENTGEPDSNLAVVERMAQFISRNFRGDIAISDIASDVHLHPNYAMTLFRRHLGMTLSRYLLLQRIAHAQRLLATTNDAVDVIASASGFGSISRFYEAFREQTGNSPRQFRLQMRPVR